MTQFICSVHRHLRWNIFKTKLTDFLCFSSSVSYFNLVKLPILKTWMSLLCPSSFLFPNTNNHLRLTIYFSPILLLCLKLPPSSLTWILASAIFPPSLLPPFLFYSQYYSKNLTTAYNLQICLPVQPHLTLLNLDSSLQHHRKIFIL